MSTDLPPSGADSTGSDFAGTDIAGADSAGSDFAGSDFAGTDFEGAHRSELRHRRIRHRRIARTVLAGITVLLGAIQGVVWANLAPGQQFQVFADGSWVTLPTADYHPFDGLMLFVLSGAAIGLIVAVAAWRIRAVRGTATLLTVFAATAAGSALAFGLGLLLARGVDPATVGKTGHNLVVVAGASLSTPLAMIAEPLVAVIVYTVLATWDGRPELGRKRAVAGRQAGDRRRPELPADAAEGRSADAAEGRSADAGPGEFAGDDSEGPRSEPTER